MNLLTRTYTLHTDILESRDGHSHFFMLYIASRDFRLFVLRTAALLNELLLSGGGVCVLPA